jgi:hypothetical protein
MGTQQWAGRMIFNSVVERDRFYDRLKDFMDGTIDVMEHDHPYWQPGLAKQNNVQGQAVTGPAFTFSLQLPDELVNDPPGGTGWVSTFETAVMALNPDPDVPTLAEIESAIGPG